MDGSLSYQKFTKYGSKDFENDSNFKNQDPQLEH